MTRVPMDVAVSVCGVKAGTIYRWVSDGRITTEKGPDGTNWYDLQELLHWVDQRNPDALMLRARLAGDHVYRMSRVAVDGRKNRVRSDAD